MSVTYRGRRRARQPVNWRSVETFVDVGELKLVGGAAILDLANTRSGPPAGLPTKSRSGTTATSSAGASGPAGSTTPRPSGWRGPRRTPRRRAPGVRPHAGAARRRLRACSRRSPRVGGFRRSRPAGCEPRRPRHSPTQPSPTPTGRSRSGGKRPTTRTGSGGRSHCRGFGSLRRNTGTGSGERQRTPSWGRDRPQPSGSFRPPGRTASRRAHGSRRRSRSHPTCGTAADRELRVRHLAHVCDVLRERRNGAVAGNEDRAIGHRELVEDRDRIPHDLAVEVVLVAIVTVHGE